MDFYSTFKNKIFSINTANFDAFAIELFHFQSKQNPIYSKFIEYLGIKPHDITHVNEIPYLPIEFFKKHHVICNGFTATDFFESSGTSLQRTSKHYIHESEIYRQSFLLTFKQFYGHPSKYTIIALLPTREERKNSSLVFMVDELVRLSCKKESGFYLNRLAELPDILLSVKGQKILFGLTYAILDFAEQFPIKPKNTLIIETGGMKGKREELSRKELHDILSAGLGIKKIHSEYGMTELFSQAYSKGRGLFKTPPWMKIMVRDQRDPFTKMGINESGCLNIIDLANISTCSFIATDDLGIKRNNNEFEVIGRAENAEIRGCNLMI